MLLHLSPLPFLALAASALCASSAEPTGIQLFLDFDDTIVVSDAAKALAAAAYASIPADYSNADLPDLEALLKTYTTVLKAVSDTVPKPTTLDEAIDAANALSVRAANEWFFIWIKELDFVKYTQEDILVEAARRMTLREGWCDFATEAYARGIHINVISRNFSPSWLRLVMREASSCPEVLNGVSTYCPEVLPSSALPGEEEGSYARNIYSGADKTELIKEILANVSSVEDKTTVVFVSDGVADLNALWEGPTNVGIVAGLENSAAEAFDTFSVTIRDAANGWRGYTAQQQTNASFVYGFDSWADVKTLLWP